MVNHHFLTALFSLNMPNEKSEHDQYHIKKDKVIRDHKRPLKFKSTHKFFRCG